MSVLRLFIISLCFISHFASALVAIPAYSQRIVDTTQTLTGSQVSELENKIIAYESAKQDGSQIAILIVASLEGEAIESYATRVFEQWKIGQKGQDNGILLLIAKNDHKVRIEVGYGLEGDLPDIIAKRIINQAIIPAFKENQYYQGITDALTDIINRLTHPESEIDTHQLKTDEDLQSSNVFRGEFGASLFQYSLVSFFICIVINQIFFKTKSSLGKKGIIVGAMNSLSSAIYTLISGFPFSSVLSVLFLVFVLSLFSYAILVTRGRSGGGGGWRGGGGSGGGGGFGGGFGGGGGGRSGGGGASGSW